MKTSTALYLLGGAALLYFLTQRKEVSRKTIGDISIVGFSDNSFDVTSPRVDFTTLSDGNRTTRVTEIRRGTPALVEAELRSMG